MHHNESFLKRKVGHPHYFTKLEDNGTIRELKNELSRPRDHNIQEHQIHTTTN